MIVELLHIWMCLLELDRMGFSSNVYHKVDHFSFPVVLYTFPGSNVPITRELVSKPPNARLFIHLSFLKVLTCFELNFFVAHQR